jgi:hypothetical protein
MITTLHRLGTTRAKAGSAEAFEKIDREYVSQITYSKTALRPHHYL